MNKVLVIVIFVLISYSASADSFRCHRKIVKSGDSVNSLLKKCGDPDRTFQTAESVNNRGRVYDVYITHYVYERGGRDKDMIITVRDNVVTKISPD